MGTCVNEREGENGTCTWYGSHVASEEDHNARVSRHGLDVNNAMGEQTAYHREVTHTGVKTGAGEKSLK